MTVKSTRRAAEIAIIDAAYQWCSRRDDVHNPDYSYQLSLAADAIYRRVQEHKELGLGTTSQPAFSNNSTDTSAEAGASMNTHVGKLAKLCFDEIGAVYRNDGVGLTVDALEQILNRSHQSVSARVNELRNKGWVTDSGIRRATRSGRSAIVWTPTVQAMNFL